MQQVRPAWRDGYFRARVVTVKKLSTDMLEVLLIPERSWPTHVAGQHIALTIEINGRLTTRVCLVQRVLAKSIELSNVDIADEFINLMGAQRNFQANTKTITTSDQMLQEVLNIKR